MPGSVKGVWFTLKVASITSTEQVLVYPTDFGLVVRTELHSTTIAGFALGYRIENDTAHNKCLNFPHAIVDLLALLSELRPRGDVSYGLALRVRQCFLDERLRRAKGLFGKTSEQ
jgi:hypothetical protein